MLGFDLETTGLDLDTARIIQYGTAHITPGQGAETIEELIDPGTPIPPESSAIHGITDAHVRGATNPETALTRIVDTLAAALTDGTPVVGHNISYDLTVLDRECRRHLGAPLEKLVGCPVAPVIDTVVLSKYLDPYRRRVSETQGAHQLRTCVEKLVTPRWPSVLWSEEEAHGALYDCRMALYVAYAILDQDPFTGVALDELHNRQAQWRADQCASLERYLRRTRPEAAVDPRWPLIPFEPRQEALL